MNPFELAFYLQTATATAFALVSCVLWKQRNQWRTRSYEWQAQATKALAATKEAHADYAELNGQLVAACRKISELRKKP